MMKFVAYFLLFVACTVAAIEESDEAGTDRRGRQYYIGHPPQYQLQAHALAQAQAAAQAAAQTGAARPVTLTEQVVHPQIVLSEVSAPQVAHVPHVHLPPHMLPAPIVYVTSTQTDTITAVQTKSSYTTLTRTQILSTYVTKTLTSIVSQYLTYTVLVTPQMFHTYTAQVAGLGHHHYLPILGASVPAENEVVQTIVHHPYGHHHVQLAPTPQAPHQPAAQQQVQQAPQPQQVVVAQQAQQAILPHFPQYIQV